MEIRGNSTLAAEIHGRIAGIIGRRLGDITLQKIFQAGLAQQPRTVHREVLVGEHPLRANVVTASLGARRLDNRRKASVNTDCEGALAC